MENDILDSLEDLGYQGPLLEDVSLQAAVSGGAASPEFTKLCAWLVSELKLYCRLEENVHATNCPSEAEGFQLEMSGLLTELTCPYSCLTRGDVTHRLLNDKDCQLLLTFLISELEAARMMLVNAPQRKAAEDGVGGPVGCSELFLELKGICVALGMSKPPPNITMFQFFSGIEKKLKEALSKVPPNHAGAPLMIRTLGPLHWEKIEAINQSLVNEYEVRRKMLLKRLDVTVQSFGWSDRAKSHTEKLAKVYQPLRSALAFKSRVCVAHLLAAREDLSKILRTSSGQTREKTSCAINKVLMGRVPDRGGRPNEIEPPPPEMPTWQKRQDGPTGGGGGRGGGRGGYDQHQGGRGGGGRGDKGGKVQGGWSDGGNQGHYQDGGRGGYRGGYHAGQQGQGGPGYQGGHQGQGYQGGGGHQGQGYQGRGGQQSQGYQGGGYQGGHQGQGYQGGGYQGQGFSGGGYQGGQQGQEGGNKGHYQDGGRQQERGGGRGGRGGRGRGGRGGQSGGWGGRGGQNFNQGGQFEQFFQHGGQQYSQAGFGQGFYSS
ncbi:protein FAM98A [Ictalurus punctatus]|uniref:Protein FAM98A n=1 Tax=Ictalurus punctatus TaxID=7998 RepID=W5U8T7_ICTPU|nr:protein FAM98A [Ictalurus punctatus]